jgi:hypothetical protein
MSHGRVFLSQYDAAHQYSTVQYSTVIQQLKSSSSLSTIFTIFNIHQEMLIKPDRRTKDILYFDLDGEERYTDILRILDRVLDPTSDRIYRSPLKGLERCTHVLYIYDIYRISHITILQSAWFLISVELPTTRIPCCDTKNSVILYINTVFNSELKVARERFGKQTFR